MEIKKPLPIGLDSYKKIIGHHCYYVDKTLLIKELLESPGRVTLITRPRRFGKTLALSTIQTFFEDERGGLGEPIDNSHYFAGRKIMDTGVRYTGHMGKYPVINLSPKSARQPEFEMSYEALIGAVKDEYKRHWYVCRGGMSF